MVITYRIVTNGRSDEITWDHFCSLMDELIESMLSIGTRFAPNNRSGLIGHRITLTINRFSVALHVALLEVSSKTMQVLIVRKNCFRRCTKEIVIPDSQQRE